MLKQNTILTANSKQNQKNPLLFFLVIAIPIIITGAYILLSTLSKNTAPITQLNQTYKGFLANITAINIKTFEAPEPTKKDKVVIMEFVINNVSSRKDYSVSTGSYDVYVNDVSVSKYYSIDSEKELNGELAPGKSAKGYWGATIPADADSIEIRIDDDFIADKYATFILKVPPVEKQMTLEDFFNANN